MDSETDLPAVTALPFDLGALHAAYAKGLPLGTVVAEVFRRLAGVDDPGIFIHLAAESEVLAAAATLGPFDPEAKPLWGIPFAVKDNIDVAGMPTTAACPEFTYTPTQDATVVALLRAAGALVIGKTNLDQFATGLVGVRTPYPVPRNALDPAIVPGGSSSGSAVVVAHGIVSFALGTDTAGSGRVPAALNGIVGLKPSLGALSTTGVVPACRTLDTVSVFALTVPDAYRVFRIAARLDDTDAYSRALPAPALAAAPPTFRVGIPDPNSIAFFGDEVQQRAFEADVETLAALGADIIPVDFTPFYKVAQLLYDGAWVAERYAAIADFLTAQPEAVHPVTRGIIESATKFSAADGFRGMYRLQELKAKAQPLLQSVDLLCVPTIPTIYSVADLAADPIGPNSRLGTYTNFVNLLDLCGIAVPTAAREDGWPGSVTLLAPAGRDAQLSAIATALQGQAALSPGATGWALPAAPEFAPAPGADELAVAMVGAHMSGLPLNKEVTRLGGRFLFADATDAVYKLYRLAGGPPYRPGLIRDPDGASIFLEVWALPKDRVGEFLAGIPAPLGLGTVVLANGQKVHGFICEAAGRDGAEDITDHGGWRAYCAAVGL